MTTLGKIRVEGDHFLKDNGTEFYYVGSTEFAQWKRFNLERGPENLVRPVLRERREVADRAGYTGPIVNRVFRYSDPGNAFGALPQETDPAQINAFLDLHAEYNMYVDWTCGDSQKSYMLPNPSDQQAWLNRFCAQTQRFCFMETCNEPFKNGQLPQHGVAPPVSAWYLRDSGNYVFINEAAGVRWEYQYDLDFISFHGDRTNQPARWPRWVCDLDDSIAALRSKVGKPPVLKEPNKFKVGDRNYYDDPAVAHKMGLRVSEGGITFHHQNGLEGNSYDEPTKAAAFNFYRGVVGAIGQG